MYFWSAKATGVSPLHVKSLVLVPLGDLHQVTSVGGFRPAPSDPQSLAAPTNDGAPP